MIDEHFVGRGLSELFLTKETNSKTTAEQTSFSSSQPSKAKQ